MIKSIVRPYHYFQSQPLWVQALEISAFFIALVVIIQLVLSGQADAASAFYYDCRRSNPWGHASGSSYSSYAYYVSQGWTCYRQGQIYG